MSTGRREAEARCGDWYVAAAFFNRRRVFQLTSYVAYFALR